MTPITLAHLIMGDGNYDSTRNRVRIYTNAFSYEDNLRIAAAVTEKLGISTSVMHDRKDQYILTINYTTKYSTNCRSAPHAFFYARPRRCISTSTHTKYIYMS